jgi:hypothetical protein
MKLFMTKTLKLFGVSPFLLLLLILFILLKLFILFILFIFDISFLSESLLFSFDDLLLLFSNDIFLIVLKLKNLSLFFISILVLLVESPHSLLGVIILILLFISEIVSSS